MTDLQLVEFYNTYRKQVETFGIINVLDDRDDRRNYRKGQKIIESTITAVKSQRKNIDWTPEEYGYIAESYFKYGRNQAQCLKYFRQFSQRHTDKSVKIALYSCPALDTKVNEISGLKDFANGLLDALNAIEPGRFVATR